MKRFIGLLLMGILFLVLVGCNGDERAATIQRSIPQLEENLTKELALEERKVEKETDRIDKERVETEQESSLEDYSHEEIEYAQVWKQVGANQAIDELHVTFIEKGEPIHAWVENSASYPEDMIQLTGTRLVDGSVTYSKNEDGTINIYHVPLRWEETTPKDVDENAMKLYTESIVENPEIVELEMEEEGTILPLIEKITH